MELQQERDYPYYLTNFMIEQHWLEKCWNSSHGGKNPKECFWKAAFQIEHLKIATIGVILFTFPFFMYNNGVFQAPRKIIMSTLLTLRSLIMLCRAGRVHSQVTATTALQWCVQFVLFQTIPSCPLPESPLTTVLSLTWFQHGYYLQNGWYLFNHATDNNWEFGIASVIVLHKEVRFYFVL